MRKKQKAEPVKVGDLTYQVRSRYVIVGHHEKRVAPQVIDFSKDGWEKEAKLEILTIFRPLAILYRDRSKYKPHQGNREVLRRLRRIRHRSNNPQEG